MKESLENLPITDHKEMMRFELNVEGHIAFTEYERNGNRIFLIHTEVPKEIEGHGIAGALVEKILQHIEANGWKLVPYCPYVQSYLRRHPDWKRILDQGIRVI